MENFSELKLSPPVAKAVKGLGYEKPTPVQREAIPILLGTRTDFLGMAATGTGKTAAFGIPLVEQVNPANPVLQGVILCPTRELAIQVCEHLEKIGKDKGVRCGAIYGGASFGNQLRLIRNGLHVIVATPGRLLDHLTQKTISLERVRTFILDEADEMISMGFQEELEAILDHSNAKIRNTWLFAATMNPSLRRVTAKYLKTPKQVEINRTEMLPGTVKQFYFKVRDANKAPLLSRLLDSDPNFYGLIFCETKLLVTSIHDYLKERGYQVDCLHGDKDQKARERSVNLLKSRKVNILVCTDVAARGLDVKDLTHVINYSIPLDLESYVHRIGRTGRSGKEGISLTLVDPRQLYLMGRIEKMTKTRLMPGTLPTREEIASRHINISLPEFTKEVPHEKISLLMSEDWKKAVSGMSKIEIAARFLSQRFARVLNDQTEVALDTDTRPPREQRERGGRGDRDRRGGFGGGRDYGSRGHRGPASPGGPRGPRNRYSTPNF